MSQQKVRSNTLFFGPRILNRPRSCDTSATYLHLAGLPCDQDLTVWLSEQHTKT